MFFRLRFGVGWSWFHVPPLIYVQEPDAIPASGLRWWRTGSCLASTAATPVGPALHSRAGKWNAHRFTRITGMIARFATPASGHVGRPGRPKNGSTHDRPTRFDPTGPSGRMVGRPGRSKIGVSQISLFPCPNRGKTSAQRIMYHSSVYLQHVRWIAAARMC